MRESALNLHAVCSHIVEQRELSNSVSLGIDASIGKHACTWERRHPS